MSTNLTVHDPYSAYERTYVMDMMEREVYGIILSAFRFRKEFGALSQNDLAHRSGKNKTQISEIMREPANREINTIAVFANAMDMDVYIAFIDRVDPTRIVTTTGVQALGTPFSDRKVVTNTSSYAQWGYKAQQAIYTGSGIDYSDAHSSANDVIETAVTTNATWSSPKPNIQQLRP
ncbi:MAG: helix-turn-helix transcriptional regulator [Roseiarcus sp.]|uniref:helix-turn-helix domain-containing protein n=1 Tax=Roseiarcus sp. TaxID=1969460 RepID=UPI003BB16729